MRFVISLALLLPVCAFAQITVTPTITLIDPGGTGGATLYLGEAPGTLQPRTACGGLGNTCLKRSDSTLTSIGDAVNTSTVTCATACGVWIGQKVRISGATVDTDLNGTYSVLTTPSATTYTITTASVLDATYTESTLQISTIQPLTTQEVWTITGFRYDASNYLIGTYFVLYSVTDPRWRNALAWASRTTY